MQLISHRARNIQNIHIQLTNLKKILQFYTVMVFKKDITAAAEYKKPLRL